MKKYLLLSGLFVSLAYANTFDGMMNGAELVKQVFISDTGKCLHYDDATIVTQDQDKNIPGEQILVKNSPNANCEWSIESNWLIDSGQASYFSGKYKNWLLIDRGTGPDNRDILVYDIVTHQNAYSNVYGKPSYIESDVLYYWKNVDMLATADNCNKFSDAQKLGLSAQLQHLVGVNLESAILRSKAIKNENRCQLMQ